MSRTVKMPVPHGVAPRISYEIAADERVIVLAVDEGAEQKLADALTEAAKELTS